MRRARLEPVDRRVLSLAVPAFGALVAEPAYNLTDTAIVGHLGRAPLGGLALATAVLSVAVYAFGFLSMATTSEVAQRAGGVRRQEAAEVAVAAYALAAAVGVVLAAAVAVSAGPLVRVLGADGPTAAAAAAYLRAAAGGLPFMLVVLAGNGHLRGLSDTRTPLAITVVSIALNVVLEVAFVYGLGLGVRGSAVATACAQATAAAAFLAVARGRIRAAGASWRTTGAHVRRLLRAGVVLVVRTLALLAALYGSTLVATRLGSVPLAAHQVALQVWFLVALSLDALAVPAQVLVGEAVGAGDVAAARRVGRRVLRWGIGTATLFGAVTAAGAPWIPRAFTGDAAVQGAAVGALLLAGLTLPVTAAAFMYDGVLLGVGDYPYLRFAMALALLAFLPLATLTLLVPTLGLLGVWGALACWLAARAGILARHWHSRRWATRGRVSPAAG